jgi:Glycosyl hydrolases family 16
MISATHRMRILRLTLKILTALLFGLPIAIRAQSVSADQWIAFNRAGAGNSNLQCFIPNNVHVSNGYLVITTKGESATCSSIDLAPANFQYTSGFVSMRSFNFLYGTVEFRAKFGGGDGSGAWPVVWMQDASCQASDPTGTDDRCNGQEIDIAEILESNFKRINQQIHLDNFLHNDGCTVSASDTSKNFHTYQLVWSPGLLVFKIDGTTTCSVSGAYVPKEPMYLKIDTFVGNYGGQVKNESLPWVTLIDNVKVTQGNSVVFSDDFDSETTVRPAQYIEVIPPPQHFSLRTIIARALRSRPIVILVISLAAIFALAVIRFRGAKSSDEGA